MFRLDSSEEEYVPPYLDVWGVYFTDEENSEQEPPNLVTNPDSILSAIEEGYESEGESTPLYNSEDDVEGSPFCLKMEYVWMASLTKHTDAGDTNPPADQANQGNAIANQGNTINNQNSLPQNPAPREDDARGKDLWEETERVLQMPIDPKNVAELEKLRNDLQGQATFLIDQTFQFEERLQQCEVLSAKLKSMASEYEVRRRHKPNLAAHNLTIRFRLKGKYDREAGPSEAPPQPYCDIVGNFVYKTPVKKCQDGLCHPQ
jgi:hypothetical protein